MKYTKGTILLHAARRRIYKVMETDSNHDYVLKIIYPDGLSIRESIQTVDSQVVDMEYKVILNKD